MEEADVVLYRTRWRRRWRERTPVNRRRNNLSPAVGLLELSNALDFAANVWNAVPPPVISKVFMALGGTGALIILAFAIADLPRAWRNTALLRDERRRLLRMQRDKESASSEGLSERDVQVYLDMNHRELGNEVIDRVGMGLLLGFGAVTVGIGTFLAIDGANPTSFLASNVITGYVGNVPAALYGLINATWCIYGWRRAQRHASAAVTGMLADSKSGRGRDLAQATKAHSRNVQIHAMVNGITGVLGGAGSLMTASAYIFPVAVWGYVILLPCAISAFTVNVYWRLKVNYDRDITEPVPLDDEKVLNDAAYARSRERLLSEYRKSCQQQHTKFDYILIRKLILDYSSATLQWLVSELEKLTLKLDGLDRDENDKEAGVSTRRSELLIQRAHIQSQIDKSNASLASLRASEENPEKQVLLEDQLDALCDLLVSADLYPALSVRLANGTNLALLLGKDLKDAQVVQSNLASMRQRLTENPDIILPFINAISETLIHDGTKHARSQTRCCCEMAGCFFGQPTR